MMTCLMMAAVISDIHHCDCDVSVPLPPANLNKMLRKKKFEDMYISSIFLNITISCWEICRTLIHNYVVFIL